MELAEDAGCLLPGTDRFGYERGSRLKLEGAGRAWQWRRRRCGVLTYCHFKGFFLLLPPTPATRLPSSSPSSPAMFTSFSLHFQFPNKRTIVASWHWLRETIALVDEVRGADHDAREAGGGTESARPWRGVLCQGNPSSRARSAKLLVATPPSPIRCATAPPWLAPCGPPYF